jgi:hypothetical protein
LEDGRGSPKLTAVVLDLLLKEAPSTYEEEDEDDSVHEWCGGTTLLTPPRRPLKNATGPARRVVAVLLPTKATLLCRNVIVIISL